MTIHSDACNRTIDITLEFQTKPLLEMQEALQENEEENEDSSEKANTSSGSFVRKSAKDSVELELSSGVLPQENELNSENGETAETQESQISQETLQENKDSMNSSESSKVSTTPARAESSSLFNLAV